MKTEIKDQIKQLRNEGKGYKKIAKELSLTLISAQELREFEVIGFKPKEKAPLGDLRKAMGKVI